MSRGTILQRGRTAAQALMADTCTIATKTGETTDDLTGAVTPTYGAPTYSGQCRIQIGQNSSSGGRSDSGEASVVIFGVSLQLPVLTSTGVERGDRVTINTCVNDPDLVGRVFYVENLFSKSDATSRRLGLVEAV
jgi:Family of unknown function (DUF6093)